MVLVGRKIFNGVDDKLYSNLSTRVAPFVWVHMRSTRRTLEGYRLRIGDTVIDDLLEHEIS